MNLPDEEKTVKPIRGFKDGTLGVAGGDKFIVVRTISFLLCCVVKQIVGFVKLTFFWPLFFSFIIAHHYSLQRRGAFSNS